MAIDKDVLDQLLAGREPQELFAKDGLLIADKAYASRWMHQSLEQRGITACIPAQSQGRKLAQYDPVLYRQRHRIENMFARLKDWRRIHTRYDRCAGIFLAGITLAAIFIFWINES